MSRRRTPSPRGEAGGHGGDDGDDGESSAAAATSVNFRVAPAIKYVLQTIFQHTGSSETSVLDHLDLAGLTWKSGAHEVISALLQFAGLQWSPDGKRLWRRGNDDELLTWAAGARPTSLRPAERGATAREEVQAAGREHDAASVKVVGSRARVLEYG